MKNLKAIKRALISSVLSLILCFSMLLGTTFAWFTDTVSSGNTVITAGNLDVELYHADKGTNGADEKVDDSTLLFDDVDSKKWEPGAMAWEKLTVENKGNLNLKYQLTLKALDATVVNGISFASMLKVAVVDDTFVYTRENVEAIPAEKWSDLATFTLTGNLEGTPEGATENPSKTYGVIIWWQPSDIDDTFNIAEEVSVKVGVTLVATQQIGESDSTGDNYDEDAWHPDMQVYNAQDLQAALNNGVTNIQLMDNIVLDESIVVPAPETVTYSLRITPVIIDLNGKTISNPNGYAIENRGHLLITGEGTVSGLGAINSVAGTLTIEGGTYTGSSNYSNNQWEHVLRVTNSSCVINGGVFDASIGGINNAMINVSDNGSVVINGGEFKSNVYNNVETYMFTYKDGGKLVINDGSFEGSWRFNSNATTEIYGGNFAVNFDGQSFNAGNAHVLTVYGGVFAKGTKLAEKLGDVVADGFQVVDMKDGTFVIYEGDSLVSTEGNNDLNTIIANAKDGDIILINAGVYEVTQLTIDNKSLTIVGIGAVVINGKQSNEHVFQLRNGSVGTANENMSITIKNVTIGGNYKSGIMVRNDLDLKVEDVTFTGTYRFSDLQVENSYDAESKFDGLVTVKAENVVANKVTMAADDGRTTRFYYEECDFAMIENQNLGGSVVINDKAAVTPSTIYFVENADELSSVLDSAAGESIIVLTNDITGNVIVKQKENVNITIDGAQHKFNGSIEIYGAARFDGAETLTIKNINFVTDKAVDFIHCNTTDAEKRYAHNVTIENCSFTGVKGADVVATRFRQCYNITIKDCIGTDLHSVLWTTGTSGCVIDNVKATCTSGGVSFSGATTPVTVKNCEFTVTDAYGYGIRVEANGAYSLTVENCTINADAPVLLRKATGAYTATLNNNKLTSANGNKIIITANDYDEGKTLTQATGNLTITVDGASYACNALSLATAVANGVTNIYLLDGEYDVYGCGGKNLTINGSKNVIIKVYNDGEDGCDYAFGGNGTGVGSYTFNGITIDTTSNTGNYKGFAYMKATFNDCNFVGSYSLNNANDFVFNRCTFDFKNGYFWTWGANSVTFNKCVFNGNSKAILAHGYASTVININNCTFAATEKGYTGAGDHTAAVEIDPAGTNVYTINFGGDNTISEFYAGWTRVKDGSNGHTSTTPTEVEDASGLSSALTNKENIELKDDLTVSTTETPSNSGYGATGVTVDNGKVFDGNGNTITVNKANGTWDCAINPKNGTVQNVTVAGAFRGIFMGSASGDVYIDNVIIKDVTYTFNSDGGNKNYGVYISNSELYGWTSYSNVHKEVVFTNCTFGEGNGYAFCRPYNASVFENCVFEEGFKFDTSKTSDIVFINCYYGDILITAENAASLGNGETTLFYNGLNGITIQ